MTIALAVLATVFAFWVVTSILISVSGEDIFAGMLGGFYATVIASVVGGVITGVVLMWLEVV